MDINPRYMARALQLAANGLGHVSPNPMVGAVIVHADRIIGEGWHRVYGQGHAEVNAVASVEDKSLLSDSTMYVTLEPCSHYGKTPPCSQLIVDSGIPRVVVATLDPFEKVSGRGIAMLREAGVEVEVGIMEQESRELNSVFFTAHTLRRPFVMLKWAQSADGYIDRRRTPQEPAAKFSTEVSSQMVHRLRGCFDAIMVGSGTVMMDRPSLNVRHIEGLRNPRPVVIDRHSRVVHWSLPGLIRIGADMADASLSDILTHLYEVHGITSILVEGGKRLLDSFVADGLWDECRIEIAPVTLGDDGAHRMTMPQGIVANLNFVGQNKIIKLRKG